MLRQVLFGLYVSGVALAGPAAHAQQIKTLGTYSKWVAYSFQDAGKQVCYAASKPIKSEGAYKGRDEIVVQVTHRPGDRATDVVSFVAGYTFKPDADVNVAVAARRFDLFTVEDRAWARDAKTDQEIVQAFIKGNSMVVKGVSSRGTPTTDTYSLQGFGAAYKAIGEVCGVRAG